MIKAPLRKAGQYFLIHCPGAAHRLAALRGWLRFSLQSGQRDNLAENLQAAFPLKSPAQIRRHCLDWFVLNEQNRLNQSRLELLNGPRLQAALARIEIRGGSHIEQACRDRRPVILVTPHYGNYMLGALRVAADYAAHGVYFFYNPPERNAYAETSNRLLERPASNCHKIYNNTHGLKTALKVLRGGGTLCMMPDLISVTASALYVPFFGRFFTAMSGIAFLALRTNALVIPCYSYTGREGRPLLEFRPPLPVPAADRSNPGDRSYTLTALLFKELERQITAHPAHWRYWHIYTKRYIPFLTPPGSIPDLVAQLRKASDFVAPDLSLVELVRQWIELLESSRPLPGDARSGVIVGSGTVLPG